MTHTHVGSRPYVGHYAVTADAYRTPGKAHALNIVSGAGSRYARYKALCGTTVEDATLCDDHFLQDGTNVVSAAEGKVTCKRCRKILAETN